MIFFLTILNLFHNGFCICKTAGNTDIKVHSFIRNCKFLDSLISTNTAFCDLMHGFFAVIRSQAAENCFCNTSCNTEDNTTTGAEAALRQALSQESYRAMEPEVLGPAPAPVVKLNNRYRYRITVVGQNEKPLRQLLAAYMKAFARRPEHRNMAVHTDCNLMD